MILSVTLRLEDRYLGICLVSVASCLIYLYLSRTNMKSAYIDLGMLDTVTIRFFQNAIIYATEKVKRESHEHVEELRAQATVESEMARAKTWENLYSA